MAKFIKRENYNICFVLILLLLAVAPILHITGQISSPLLIFLGRCIAFAIVAIGLDLIWGFTGILSLGHGIFFALGGYAMAMRLTMQQNDGELTNFMRVGGFTELPLVWRPFLNGPVSFVLIVAVPGVLAFVLGYFIFKKRVKGVYFSIISQALTWAAFSFFIAMSPITNGDIGITGVRSLLGSIRGDANRGNLITLFYISLAVLAVVYAISAFLVRVKFGKLLIAIRDGENRTYFSGYRVSRYKTFIYVLSAVFAGIAGAIFVNFNGSISPSQMTIAFSINMVIWVAIGGRGTLVGAVIGTFVINLADYNFSAGAMVEIWPYIMGGIFCITILFFKGGIVGLFREQFPALAGKIKTGVAAKWPAKKQIPSLK